MLKRPLYTMLALILILVSMSTAVSANTYYYDEKWHEHSEAVSLYYDGTEIACDVPPIIYNNRTLVPARAFFENLGAKVLWDSYSREVTVITDDVNIILTIDSNVAYVNNERVSLDVSAKIISDSTGTGRTMIPVRFVSDRMGCSVGWDPNTAAVYINSPTGNEKITAIKSTKKNDTDIIEISTSSKSNPVIMKMANPDRLVLDFYGFDLELSSEGFSKNGLSFSDIRYANHNREYARIVFDITGEYKYDVELSENTCKIVLTPKEIGVTAPKPEEPAGTGLVVIDPGHGGSDPGAIGYKDGIADLHESEVNLDIALQVYDMLKAQGVNVAITRTTDVFVGLNERAEYANNLDASLFICIHNNSSTIPSANGTMVYYYTGDTDAETKELYGLTSKELAQIIHEELIISCERYDRKIADGSGFVVLKNTKMPAILTEGAFLSNDEERELLKTPEFRTKMAEGITSGVLKALDIAN